jgi:hypothetical protein
MHTTPAATLLKHGCGTARGTSLFTLVLSMCGHGCCIEAYSNLLYTHVTSTMMFDQQTGSSTSAGRGNADGA